MKEYILFRDIMKRTPKIILLPQIKDIRGNLSFLEGENHIPFAIQRAYWIYDVPSGEVRGGHAFREQDEFIIALSGSFDVVIHSGKRQKRHSLNRSYFGLLVPRGYWRSMENFSTNSVALVLASTPFNTKDYIYNFDEFLTFVQLSGNRRISKINHTFSKPLLNNTGATNTVNDCKVLQLDKNHREKGNITVIENRTVVPFDIDRVYYLYDVPGGEERGGHAHKELCQLIVAASGSFDVVLDDGKEKRTVTLNRPYQGLYMVPGIWRELVNFSSGSSCLVLASHRYEEADYIRNHSKFIDYKNIV